MKVDVSQSEYREAHTAKEDFTRSEIRSARLLLRRLRFLEKQVRENEGVNDPSGGAQFAIWEVDALEWVLTEVGFLETKESDK